MTKTSLGAVPFLVPMPTLLIGSMVGRKSNFMTAAWGGIACGEPAMLSVAIRPGRHTYQGIKDSGVFSVNLPNASQARETDLCGIVSGAEVDKAELCGFTLFFGASALAPMIEECPVNLECRVHQIIPLGSHDLVIARIEETFVTSACLTDGKPDADKIDPLVYLPGVVKTYGRLGETVAKAFSAGLALKR